jgi:hypothetical protein
MRARGNLLGVNASECPDVLQALAEKGGPESAMDGDETTRRWLQQHVQFRQDKLRSLSREDREGWVASIAETLERSGLGTKAAV